MPVRKRVVRSTVVPGVGDRSVIQVHLVIDAVSIVQIRILNIEPRVVDVIAVGRKRLVGNAPPLGILNGAGDDNLALIESQTKYPLIK